MAKEGSTISGLMDSFATAISYSLPYGVPLKFFVDKFSHVRFEPSGWTGNPAVPYAKSIMDYIFRWMATARLTMVATLFQFNSYWRAVPCQLNSRARSA